jgi:hypothetical protein
MARLVVAPLIAAAVLIATLPVGKSVRAPS